MISFFMFSKMAYQKGCSVNLKYFSSEENVQQRTSGILHYLFTTASAYLCCWLSGIEIFFPRNDNFPGQKNTWNEISCNIKAIYVFWSDLFLHHSCNGLCHVWNDIFYSYHESGFDFYFYSDFSLWEIYYAVLLWVVGRTIDLESSRLFLKTIFYRVGAHVSAVESDF